MNIKTLGCLYPENEKEYDFAVDMDVFPYVKKGDLVVVDAAPNRYQLLKVASIKEGLTQWAKRFVVAVHPVASLDVINKRNKQRLEEHKKKQQEKETAALIDEFI